MNDAWPLVSAALLGGLSGFVASVPGGPVNATLLAEGGHKGFRWAFFVGLGAVVMETLYCSAAFAGFDALFGSRLFRATMELVSFLLMLWLGVKYLLGAPMPGEARGVRLMERRFHPHTAFWTGFVRVLGNPGILLLWITVTAMLLSRDWLADTWPSKRCFVGGVASGALLWFTLLAWGVARHRDSISPAALRRLSQVSGVLLLGVAVVVGVRLIGLLAARHP
ncbi:MAG: LysE family translocator [Verrucomicrobiota bacterium]